MNKLTGTHRSDETKRKLSETHKKIGTIPPFRKGIKHTEETKLKMSLDRQGMNRYPRTQEHKDKISKTLMGKYIDDKNGNWKGDNAGYSALHYWVVNKLGKAKICSICGTIKSKKYEWSNISGKYYRKLNDWQQLCCKCYKKFDKENISGSFIIFKEKKCLK